MDANEAPLDVVAGAILDGTSVDWRTVQSSANEPERQLLDELHALATLADFHRQQRAESARPVQTWGHIRVVELLGTGAFGRVYRGWDTRLDREVALKLLSTHSDAEDVRTSSIIEEGRLLARVRHPNVVTIYGADRIGDTIGLWMELIEGETLERRLTEGLPFQPCEVIEIGTQICHAVSAVHGAGLLHRDIKTQNVMRAADGRAVLMDFGTGWEMSKATTADALAGTPLYLAPELLRGGEATVQSDVYSVGVLLYRMLSGTYPVRADNVGQLRIAHERGDRDTALTVRRDVPRRLARVIERAIDPDAERRYASASALASALAALKPRSAVIPLGYAIGAMAGALALGGLLLSGGVLRLRHEAFATEAGALRTSTTPTHSDEPAIAVLPLKNLSAETGGEEFADGFTEEIINSLAASEHVQVRSRTSSFAFKNNRQDLQDLARQLDVDLVLDGSIRRSGNRFQVEARLLRAPTGVMLWNEGFDADVANIFAARNRIVQGVVRRLGVKGAPTRRAYDLSPDAYGHYLTARALVSHRGVIDPQKAIDHFQQVIAVAPDFAPAYAGLADAYAYMSIPERGASVGDVQERMRTAALKALQLDPDLAEAHAAMGLIYARDLAWPSSERHFERAIALNPSLSQVYTSYSFFTLRPLRKFDRAERLMKTAMQRDPLSLDVWREMAQLYFTVGRYDEAIELLQRVRTVDPELPFADLFLARALACRGRLQEARALYDSMESQGPAGARADSRASEGVAQYRAYVYVKAGRRSDAEQLAAQNGDYPYRATIIYAALGDLDRAFEALARTVEREPQRVPLLLTWPETASLRGDPRIAAIKQRFGLP